MLLLENSELTHIQSALAVSKSIKKFHIILEYLHLLSLSQPLLNLLQIHIASVVRFTGFMGVLSCLNDS